MFFGLLLPLWLSKCSVFCDADLVHIGYTFLVINLAEKFRGVVALLVNERGCM